MRPSPPGKGVEGEGITPLSRPGRGAGGEGHLPSPALVEGLGVRATPLSRWSIGEDEGCLHGKR